MPTLELKNVSYAYEKSKAVLQNVSAELETGKMYAILGPSGSGKTTLLSLLGGLDVPTQGSVLFDGEDITTKGLEHHRRNHISLIFQSYNLIDYMTPIENVRLTAKLDAAPILERLGLEQDEIARNVLKLSGGQQQRVAIARALASDAPVILADEPTSTMDKNFFLIEKTSIHVIIHRYTKRNRGFQQNPFTFFRPPGRQPGFRGGLPDR